MSLSFARLKVNPLASVHQTFALVTVPSAVLTLDFDPLSVVQIIVSSFKNHTHLPTNNSSNARLGNLPDGYDKTLNKQK